VIINIIKEFFVMKVKNIQAYEDMYDSKEDTLNHIINVRKYAGRLQNALFEQTSKHDKSKLEEPEKPIFDEYTPKLKNCVYGSDEYKTYLKEMQVALKHHYANNRHHPEHFEDLASAFS